MPRQEDPEIIADGQSYRVPMLLMDELQQSVARDPLATRATIVDGRGNPAGHGPGYAFRAQPYGLEDSVRSAWEQRGHDQRNAWRQTPTVALNPARRDGPTAPVHDQPQGIPAHDLTKPSAALAAARDEAYEARGAVLRDAWKG